MPPKRRRGGSKARPKTKAPAKTPPSNISLASLIQIIYNSQRLPMPFSTLHALRLTSRDLKAAADPYIESVEIHVSHDDLDALKRSSLIPYISHVTLAVHNAPNIYAAMHKFCIEISLPKLDFLTIQKLDTASLPLLGRASWPHLKDLSFRVIDASQCLDSPYYLSQSWTKGATWSLERLSVHFESEDVKSSMAVAATLSSFPKLVALSMNKVSTAEATAIAEANLSNLQRLLLGCHTKFPGDDRAIAGSLWGGNWAKLSTLMLQSATFMPGNMQKLVETSCLASLTTLDLMQSPISAGDARLLLGGLNKGPIGALGLKLPPEGLLNFEKLSLPGLNTLYLSLYTFQPESINQPMEALIKSHLPELASLRIFADGQPLTWMSYPNVADDQGTCLSSVLSFEFHILDIGHLPLAFLGRHLLAKNVVDFKLKAMQTSSLDPIYHLLVPVSVDSTRILPLEVLSVPVLRRSMRNLFDQVESKFPNITHFSGDYVVNNHLAQEKRWTAVISGSRKATDGPLEKVACGVGSGRVALFTLELGVAAVHEFMEAYSKHVFVTCVSFPVEAETPEEKEAKEILREAFPTAGINS